MVCVSESRYIFLGSANAGFDTRFAKKKCSADGMFTNITSFSPASQNAVGQQRFIPSVHCATIVSFASFDNPGFDRTVRARGLTSGNGALFSRDSKIKSCSPSSGSLASWFTEVSSNSNNDTSRCVNINSFYVLRWV